MALKILSKTEEKIIRANEADANRRVAWVMFFTFCLFSFMYILNLVGIFIVPVKVFTFAYISSAILLLVPILFNKIFSPDAPWLKHLYIINTGLFLLIAIVTLSYHATVVYAFPIAVAGIYYSRKEMILSTIMTCVITIVAQIIGYKLDFLHDANFLDFSKMVLFGIVPRLFTLIALSSLLYMINQTTARLMSEQLKAAEKIKKHNQDMVMIFSTLLESHDENTGKHLQRTKEYVSFIAKEMKNSGLYSWEMDDDFIELLEQAAPLHDIGKNGIKEDILAAKRRLTPEEFEIIKTHTVAGSTIIEKVLSEEKESSGISANFKEVAVEITKYHHEKWDGSGYPENLSQYEIPLAARIMSIADVFDAISSDRPYRDAMPMEECFKIIEEGRGTHFDPIITDLFLKNKEKIIKIRNRINKEN